MFTETVVSMLHLKRQCPRVGGGGGGFRRPWSHANRWRHLWPAVISRARPLKQVGVTRSGLGAAREEIAQSVCGMVGIYG